MRYVTALQNGDKRMRNATHFGWQMYSQDTKTQMFSYLLSRGCRNCQSKKNKCNICKSRRLRLIRFLLAF